MSLEVKGQLEPPRRLRDQAVNWLCRHRYAKYNTVNGVEERTLYKAFGIRFDVMVFGQVRLSTFSAF